MISWNPFRRAGAALALTTALTHLRSGAFDLAASWLRDYAARRFRPLGWLSEVDLSVFALGALTAALRSDLHELEGYIKLADSGGPGFIRAREQMDLCHKVLVGDLAGVKAAIAESSATYVRDLQPMLLLTTAEQGVVHLTPADVEELEDDCLAGPAAAALGERFTLLQLVVAVRGADAAQASRALARARSQPSGLLRLVAVAMEGGAYDDSEDWRQASVNERTSLLALLANAAPFASVPALQRWLGQLDGSAPPWIRVAMVVGLAIATARGGDVADARRRLDDAGDGPITQAVRAYLLMLGGAASEALALLAPATDPISTALRLVATGMAHEQSFVREVEESGIEDPVLADHLRGTVLALLASLPRVPPALPEWLEAEPTDPQAAYCWATIRARQGATEEAVAAFQRAVAAAPELEERVAHEQTALQLARARFLAGDLTRCEELLASIHSGRLREQAARLEALCVLRRRAGARAARLHLDDLDGAVAALGQNAAAGSGEERAARLLTSMLRRWRVREDLAAGRHAKARGLLDSITEEDEELAFLRAVVTLFEGAPLEKVRASLEAHLAKGDGYAGLRVLLSDIVAVTQDAGQAVAVLESAPSSATSGVVAEALADHYGAASRSLDAKRLAFDDYRRAGAASGTLAKRLREALSLELPRLGSSGGGARIERGSPSRLLDAETVAERAPLLLLRARRLAAESPLARATLEGPLRDLEASLGRDDPASVSARELALIRTITSLGGTPR